MSTAGESGSRPQPSVVTQRLEGEGGRGPKRLSMLAAALAVIVLLAAAIGLWARHGAAVFFDMVASGIAYCF